MEEMAQRREFQRRIGWRRCWHWHQNIQNHMILNDQAIYFPSDIEKGGFWKGLATLKPLSTLPSSLDSFPLVFSVRLWTTKMAPWLDSPSFASLQNIIVSKSSALLTWSGDPFYLHKVGCIIRNKIWSLIKRKLMRLIYLWNGIYSIGIEERGRN